MTEDMQKLVNLIRHVLLKKANKTNEVLTDVKEHLKSARDQLQSLELRDRYFYNKLSGDINFEERDEFKVFRECLPNVSMVYKRLLIIIHILREFLKQSSLDTVYGLNKNALTKIGECYISDLYALKKRYGSTTVQLPKIAGLMTNLIMKYRPICPKVATKDPAIYINEVFAIHHALCICSDFSDGEELIEFEKTGVCSEFYKDLTYLLNRNYTAESLIMIFKVLCLDHFPSFLTGSVEG